MRKPGWSCLKCKHDAYEATMVSSSGTGWSQLLDLQNRRFTTLTCKRCRFTELYRGDMEEVRDILDKLFG